MLNNLRFADDIAILSNDLTDIQEMMQELADESKKVGLKMNYRKTKVLKTAEVLDGVVSVNHVEIEQVTDYCYLGQNVSLIEKDSDKEVRKRIGMGWKKFGEYSTILKSNIPLCLKRQIIDQCITPRIIYGCECWTMSTKMEKKLGAAQRNMERSILGITYKDKKTNIWVRKQIKVKDIIKVVKMRKWTWAGHVSRRTDNRWTQRLTQWQPRDGKRSRGRQRKRWRDDLDKYWGHSTWQRVAEERHIWRSHAEAFVLQWTDHG